MEEMFLHAWDELDDTLCLCRQLATIALTDAWSSSVAMLASVPALLIAGTATALLATRQFFDPSA